jgi:hypothetical protein
MSNRAPQRILAGVAAVILWLCTLAVAFMLSFCTGSVDEQGWVAVGYSLGLAPLTGVFAWAAAAHTVFAARGRWPPPARFVPITGTIVGFTVLADAAGLAGG